jgi:hypothetical protein
MPLKCHDCAGRPIRRHARLAIVGLAAALTLAGCGSAGAPGAAEATGDTQSQAAADKVISQYVDYLRWDLPRPTPSNATAVAAAVPDRRDMWHAVATRELVSATGAGDRQRLLVKVTVEYTPSNTADWDQAGPARVTRCFEVSPEVGAGDGLRSSHWTYGEHDCPEST